MRGAMGCSRWSASPARMISMPLICRLQSAPPAQCLRRRSSPALRGKNGKSKPPKPLVTLDLEASLRQRDELLVELAAISSFDDAAEWAKRIIPIKNTLTAEHARDVEAALEVKLAQVGDRFGEPLQVSETPIDGPKMDSSPPSIAEVSPVGLVAPPARGSTSALEFENYAVTPKTRRRRDKRHRQFVAAQACVICGRQPSDAHHLRFAQPRGLGLKVSDEFTVPLCRSHHRDLHRTNNETRWWAQFGIQPMNIAYKLWTKTHPVTMAVNAETPGIEALKIGGEEKHS